MKSDCPAFSIIKKEASFLDIIKEQREVIIDAARGKILEINLLDFFASIE